MEKVMMTFNVIVNRIKLMSLESPSFHFSGEDWTSTRLRFEISKTVKLIGYALPKMFYFY